MWVALNKSKRGGSPNVRKLAGLVLLICSLFFCVRAEALDRESGDVSGTAVWSADSDSVQQTEIKIVSSSFKQIDEQKAFIESSLNDVNSSLVFKGYCRVGDPVPDPIANNAYLALQPGTIFGKEVAELQFLVANGADFDVLTVDTVKNSVILIPSTFSSNATAVNADYDSANRGLVSTGQTGSSYMYSIIPGQEQDSLMAEQEGSKSYSVTNSASTSVLSAVYTKADSAHTTLTVLNQREGNNLKVLNQPVAADPNVFDFGTDATYFVSSSEGDDANDGLSPERPKKTLAAAARLLKNGLGGQKLALKAGDSWNISSMVQPVKSGVDGAPIKIGAYGKGKRPKIDCTEEIVGWKNYSGNIYKASIDFDPGQLFVDGNRAIVARYPNQGFLSVSTIRNSNSITSANLNSALNLNGASMIYRNTDWTVQNLVVSSGSGQTINYTYSSTVSPEVGRGFILMNKLQFLDEANEWYYDAKTGTVYLWLEDNVAPSAHEIRCSHKTVAIQTWGCHYLWFENLDLFGGDTGFYITASDHITIDNCNVHGFKTYGIHMSDDNSKKYDFLISNNLIQDCCFGGISDLSDTYPSKIVGNKVWDIGLLPQLHENSNGQPGKGIIVRGEGALVEYNDIRRVGYSGITSDSPNGILRYNYIEDALVWLADGGAIYTNGMVKDISGLKMYNNIINRVHSSTAGLNRSHWAAAAGIYCDWGARRPDLRNNVIYDCGYGFFLGTNDSTVVEGNLIVNCSQAVYVFNQNTPSFINKNTIVVESDTIAGTPPWIPYQQAIMKNGNANPSSNLNTFVSLYHTKIFKISGGAADADLATWTSQTGNDTHSKIITNITGKGILFFNSSKETKTVSLSGLYITPEGSVVNSLQLEPFTGQVVLKK